MVHNIIAAGVLIENKNNEILVLKRNSDKPEGNKWGLPAGKVDAGETPEQAAVREVYEEIGYMIDPASLVLENRYDWVDGETSIVFWVYRVYIKNDIKIVLDLSESSEYLWLKPQKLYQKEDLMSGLYSILKDVYPII